MLTLARKRPTMPASLSLRALKSNLRLLSGLLNGLARALRSRLVRRRIRVAARGLGRRFAAPVAGAGTGGRSRLENAEARPRTLGRRTQPPRGGEDG